LGSAYIVVGGAGVFLVTGVLAVFAAHRLQPHPRRWLCFGIGVYVLVRILTLVISPPLPGDLTTGARPGDRHGAHRRGC
jgi:hypothetical protein